MSDDCSSNEIASENTETEDPGADAFAQVASGVYRSFSAELVWVALEYAMEHQLFLRNPAVMLTFVRIAEVYPAAREFLAEKRTSAKPLFQAQLKAVLEPAAELRDARFLPDSIQSPGEMDLCWAEFLVTGKTAVVERILEVLDRPDRTRDFLAAELSGESAALVLSDAEKQELQRYGIGLGKLSEGGAWAVMTPGDTDVFLLLGVKDQDPICKKVFEAMDEALRLHVACKGAALWSLQANTATHGTIRLFCEEAAKQPGGFGRSLLLQ
ncbi:MAG TPA: hypothetical protein DDW52_02185 [Planctomycetaceae bacterium]|nr:hypothetical protein [Planctomycetaceae bacterium]